MIGYTKRRSTPKKWWCHLWTVTNSKQARWQGTEWYHGRLLIFCCGGGKPIGRYATAVHIWKADDDYPRNSHLDCSGENQRGCRLLPSWKLPMDLKTCCVSIHTIAWMGNLTNHCNAPPCADICCTQRWKYTRYGFIIKAHQWATGWRFLPSIWFCSDLL